MICRTGRRLAIALAVALAVSTCGGDDDVAEERAATIATSASSPGPPYTGASPTGATTGPGTAGSNTTEGAAEGPRVIVEFGAETLVFTPDSPVFACDADRGEAEVVVEEADGASVKVRVPEASGADTEIELILSDGGTWVGTDADPDVLLTDGTLVLRTDVANEGGSSTELVELTAVCR